MGCINSETKSTKRNAHIYVFTRVICFVTATISRTGVKIDKWLWTWRKEIWRRILNHFYYPWN